VNLQFTAIRRHASDMQNKRSEFTTTTTTKDFSDKYMAKQTKKTNFHQHTENSASWASFQKGTLSLELFYTGPLRTQNHS